MAANDNQHPLRPSSGAGRCLDAQTLAERVEEEIARAERHRTALSCLLVGVEGLEIIEQAHGKTLSAQTLAYVGLALRQELRPYDRVGRPCEHEFLIVLPGADAPRGEVIARRVLARLRAIKIEARGERTALRVAGGIATWHEGLHAQDLIAAARTAAGRQASEESSLSSPLPPSPPAGPLGFSDALRI